MLQILESLTMQKEGEFILTISLNFQILNIFIFLFYIELQDFLILCLIHLTSNNGNSPFKYLKLVL